MVLRATLDIVAAWRGFVMLLLVLAVAVVGTILFARRVARRAERPVAPDLLRAGESPSGDSATRRAINSNAWMWGGGE